ncbi:MAG TPA: Ppx/GppA phosphatase family protein, partial [Candidatus Polarisedimenticolia bacterium]|nr:Ppx/GppA phosphatase family protein [Candidatus Polarisedimenticolia bacterium]
MRLRPLAVVDIGSNTIRSLIVQTLADGTYRILDDERDVARLASGLNRRGGLSAAAIQRAVNSLKRMADIIRARTARKVTVVATSAIRNASNRQLFLDRVQAETGLRVRVISAKEEARLAFESAAGSFDLAGRPCAVADVGGGSTEVILALGSHIRTIHCLPLGAVGLTEEFLPSDPVRGKEFRALRSHVKRQLEEAGMELDPAPQFLIASGGTATSLAQMALARQGLSGRPVQGYEMTQAELLHLRQALLRRSLEERRQMAGLSPERADIILAGATILYEILDHLKVNTLKVSNRGIRHALLNRLIARNGPRTDGPPVQRQRVSAAESFGSSLGFEHEHGEQVRQLSLSLFDQMKDPLRLEPGSRDLLAAAALLHDVGYVVGYRQHHKHSYHLIANAHLDGFTPREREIIALVARYHRRAAPRKKHSEWAKLPREDRKLVRQLSSLLRIADALDRRHSKGIREIHCRVRGDQVRIALETERDVSVELHGAMEKSRLFEEVFGKEIQF